MSAKGDSSRIREFRLIRDRSRGPRSGVLIVPIKTNEKSLPEKASWLGFSGKDFLVCLLSDPLRRGERSSYPSVP
jgi:hypothetical protein